MALRYLTRRPMAIFAIGSVALCIVLMIIITSLFNGFLDLYNDYWKYEYGQVSLHPEGNIADYNAVADFLEKQPEIAYVRLSVESGGLLFTSNGNVKQVIVKGINLARECRADQFKNGLLGQTTAAMSKFELSNEQTAKAEEWLAQKLGRELEESDRPAAIPCIMSVGILGKPDPQTDNYDYSAINNTILQWDRPAFIFTAEGGNTNDQAQIKRKTLRCWPVDAVETGSNHLDEMVLYMPFEYVREEFDADAKLLIVGKDGISDRELAEIVSKYWRDYALNVLELSYQEFSLSGIAISSEQTWVEIFNREIQKQLSVLKVILGFVCMIAGVLIFVIIMMIVLQKRRDIGIIRAVGSSKGSVLSLFVSYGIMIGICGTATGLIIGVWAVHNIEMLESSLSAILGFKIWKAGSYGFSQMPNWVHWQSLYWIISSGIVTAASGAVIPAIKAAHIQPAEALRFE